MSQVRKEGKARCTAKELEVLDRMCFVEAIAMLLSRRGDVDKWNGFELFKVIVGSRFTVLVLARIPSTVQYIDQ